MEQQTWKHYLGRPGKLEKWTHYGAGGRRVCPRVPPGLPIWKQLPLDRKLPYMPAPSNVDLTRGLPAEKLLSRRPAHDFRLFDANCRELHTPYESLHDPHLKKHFKKDGVVSCLRNAGHMNKNKEALAELKKVNKFRQMSRLMNLDHIHYRMKLESQTVTDGRRLQQIEDYFQETQYKREMEEKFKNLRVQHQEEIKERTEETLKRWHEKFLQKEHQVRKLKRTLCNKQRGKQIQSTARGEKVKRNLEHISQCKRKQLLGLKRKLRERELQLNNKKAQELSSKAQQRIEQIKQKWETKCAEMTSLSLKSKVIIGQVMETRQANIEIRKERAARVKKAQEELKMKRLMMRREKPIEQFCDNRPKPRENEKQGVPEQMVDFLIDTAIISHLKKIITPLMSYASRLAIEHGFSVLTQLRMDRSKTTASKTITDNLQIKEKTEYSISSGNNWSSKISKKRTSLAPDRNGSSIKFETDGEGPFSVTSNPSSYGSELCKATRLTEKCDFPEKNKLEHSCEHAVTRLLSFAKFIISECVEPRTRALTIKKLSKYEHCQEELIDMLANSVYQEYPQTEAIVAAGIARAAIIAIFNPAEWRKPKSELAEMRRVLLAH